MSTQQCPFLPQMLSPTSYEIGRYGRTPVSYFHGLPNISVPLTEVRAKGYTLPVTLSYHAGGNKPEMHPGWVGLGWSLHAGGSIIRVINGMKDEMSKNEYNARGGASGKDPGYLYHIDEVQTETDWGNANTLAAKSIPSIEYEPDEYIINVDGIHASFFITGQNKISIVSKEESAFELDSYEIDADVDDTALDMYFGKYTRKVKARRYQYIKQFIIRDKNGNRYFFGGDDTAIEYSVIQRAIWNATEVSSTWSAFATANAWMLTKIERADGEVITFEYEKNGVPIVMRDIHHGELFVEDGTSPYVYDIDTYRDFIDGRKSNLNFHFLIPSYLKAIRCLVSGDELLFVTTDSAELPIEFTEADFKKYVINPSGNYDVISYLQFQTENRYRKLSQITGVNRDIRLEYISSATTRLKLSTVEFLKGGIVESRYSFSYNGTSLPSYNSRKTDNWGYYNGIDYSDLLGYFGQGLTERRAPVENAMKAEMLTRITYPTGGHTEFEYEAHRYSKKAVPFTFAPETCEAEGIAGGLRIKSITDYAENGVPQTRTFEYEEDGVSSGILCSESQSRVEGQCIGYTVWGESSGTYIIYSEMPMLPLSETDGSHVTYSFVRERFPDGGYVDYRFSNFDTSGCQDQPPANEVGRIEGSPLYPKFTSNALLRGLLKERITYKSDGSLVLKETYVYAGPDPLAKYKSVSQHRFCNNVIRFAAYVSENCCYPALVSKTETRYMDDGTSVTDIHGYQYDSQRLLSSATKTRNGESSGECYFYPKDRIGNSYVQMEAAGMYGVPVGRATLRNDKVVKAIETSYKRATLLALDNPTLMVPCKIYRDKMATPPSLDSYKYDPTLYIDSVPDVEVKSHDDKGNVRFAALRNGSAMEYHWVGRLGQPAMAVRTTDVNLGDEWINESYRFPLVSVQPYTKSFYTSSSERQVIFSLYADSGYAWYVYVTVDGTTYYLAHWNKTGVPDAHWTEILSNNQASLNISLPAGDHIVSINHVEWSGPSGASGATGASMQIGYYQEKVFQETATFVDLDTDTESGEGFHCEKGHVGPLTVSRPVASGKAYILDYMLKTGDTWQYIKASYTGGSVTIGASGKTVSNVRIYPTDCLPGSFMWRPFTGMSARMDARGVTESYGYDDAGRLSEIRDNGGCKVKAHSYTFGEDNTLVTDEFTSAAGTSKRRVIRRYDGIGRLSQDILVGGSGDGRDVVTMHEYDLMDREVRTWLPVPLSVAEGTTPTKSQIQSAGSTFYGSSETVRYSGNVYENSVTDRLLRKYGPGKAWTDADKAVRMTILSNVTIASQPTYYRGFSISWLGSTLMLSRNANPTTGGTFLIERIEDEDGRVRLDFRNIHGETVLSRAIGDGGVWHDTHFIYDSFGRIAAVLPPKLTADLEASGKSSWMESEISDLAFLYRYDSRGNNIAKLLPGGGWTYFIYDKGNRLVLIQDAVQRSQHQWTFRLEDLFGRECVTGTTTLEKDVYADPLGDVNVYVTIPTSPNYANVLKGYVLRGLSLGSDVDLLNVSYYDGYGFLGSGPFPAATDAAAAYDSSAEIEYGSRYSLSERGLATGSLVKVLDSSETELYLWNLVYYDDKGRPVQTREATHMGGVRKEYFAYDFTGNVTRRKTVQVASSGAALTVVQSYTYDAMGRPLTTTHKIGNGVQRTISSKSYDELGRLSADNRNGLVSLKETRSYNLRSWLTNIDGQMFTEALKYENSTIPQWGGNISVMQWGESAVQNAYSFIYDTHSRLQTANYSNSSSAGLYSEIYNYDLNGNMLRHVRGSQPLVMSYSGNRLMSAGNAAFEYDSKGRQVMSTYGSGLSTLYNILDLPQRQTTGEGTVVDYKYAFDGRKLQEKVTAGASVTQRDYSGEFLYEGGVLKKILFDGGYVMNDVSGPVYMFFLRDHLGSVRAVVSETGAVQQRNNYFPYGDLFPNTSIDSSANRYRYTGKESGDEIGLYDFSARFLHTRFGRFTTIDPLAEKYPGISPYAYCNCNPVIFVDPDGMESWRLDRNGYLHRIEGDDNRIYSTDKDGNQTQQYIEISNPEIINSLSSVKEVDIGNNTKVKASRITSKSNINDLFKFFLFAADNTDVEWTLHRDVGNNYTLGTIHEEDSAGNWSYYDVVNPIASVHSHPISSQSYKREVDTMGIDWGNVQSDFQRHGKQTRMNYVYFPKSTRLYHIEPSGYRYVRDILGDYQRLYFGTLNHK